MPGEDGFSGMFLEWLTETAGVPKALLLSLDKDDDWTFVIKMFGILEAGISVMRIMTVGMMNHFESYKWEAEIARFAERAKSTPKE